MFAISYLRLWESCSDRIKDFERILYLLKFQCQLVPKIEEIVFAIGSLLSFFRVLCRKVSWGPFVYRNVDRRQNLNGIYFVWKWSYRWADFFSIYKLQRLCFSPYEGTLCSDTENLFLVGSKIGLEEGFWHWYWLTYGFASHASSCCRSSTYFGQRWNWDTGVKCHLYFLWLRYHFSTKI